MLRLGTLTIASLAIHHVANAAVIPLISEPNMPTGVFSTMVVNPTGGFSYSVAQAASGGNPGAYRTISHASTSGFASGLVVHVHQTTWHPLNNDAIYSLDIGVDVNCFNGGTSAAVGFGLVVIQGGDVFYGPSFTAGTASGWRSALQRTNLRSVDFGNSVGQHPDFTPTGGTIAFGFYSSNGTGSGIPISSSSGADNFNVTIHTCAADANGDGFIDGFDYDDFVSCFEGTGNPPCVPGLSADFNGDGFADGFDYDDFITAFEDGC